MQQLRWNIATRPALVYSAVRGRASAVTGQRGEVNMNHDLPEPVVLIVEDDWLILAEIAEEFQQAGWTVLEASTGEGSVAAAQNGQRIDAVVTDIQLAGTLSGWDVADAFRTLNPNIPVIYSSGNLVDNYRMVPGSVFFTKPYKTAELLETCRRLSRVSGSESVARAAGCASVHS